tara:strand:- start:585 stop:791 length:207 start_codon:yes stop_codon:yes gene_type:complete
MKRKKVRSKHNNLMNYFIIDERDLSPAYLASCRKFLKEISSKPQAPSATKQTQLKSIIKTERNKNAKI